MSMPRRPPPPLRHSDLPARPATGARWSPTRRSTSWPSRRPCRGLHGRSRGPLDLALRARGRRRHRRSRQPHHLHGAPSGRRDRVRLRSDRDGPRDAARRTGIVRAQGGRGGRSVGHSRALRQRRHRNDLGELAGLQAQDAARLRDRRHRGFAGLHPGAAQRAQAVPQRAGQGPGGFHDDQRRAGPSRRRTIATMPISARRRVIRSASTTSRPSRSGI